MTDHDERRRARLEMDAAADNLIREFSQVLPTMTVHRHLALAREDLLAAGVRAGLAHAAEAMARARLSRIVPAHSADQVLVS